MKSVLKAALMAGVMCLGGLTPAAAQSGHVITMQDADIRAFIDDVSMVTGKTFLVDPRVQGKVTISSDETLSSKEVFEVFKDVMRVHGYTATRTATGEYRITLLQGAAQDAPFVTGSGFNGQFATTVIRLENTDAAEAAKLLKPVLHSQGVLTANPGGRVVVITDFPENLRKAREIVNAMDSDGMVMETMRLNNITAIDAEEVITALAGVRPTYRAIAMPGSNSIILEGSAADIARLRPILSQMDAGGSAPRGAVSVVPLRFADGSSLIEILGTLLPAYQRDGQPQPTVAYEAGSNSLIISANGETQQALETVIRRLDVRRPQVLVEALIVEISDTAAKELGVQFALGGINGSAVPFIGSNFSRQAPNILALTGALAGNDLGLTESTRSALETSAINSLIGLDGGIAGGAGRSGDTLFSAIINALETDEESNILSTPFVTTLDNVPATFLVGQEIPITTGETLGDSNTNPFRTFDRKEVGIQLDVLPQISEGDVIRLEIEQEVSSIAGALTSVASDFVTNTRKISTTVLANDGEIIVLGGLIQDDEEVSLSKVPILGDAPGIGKLFQSKGKSRVRTNLMVFLRPTIIRNSRDAQPLTERRLNQIRREDMMQSGRTTSKLDQVLDSGGQPVLGQTVLGDE
ncbi:secretin N-terminal domain-containing protein [Fretibacter rubidus]|uniref:secretin N-terminal domain-containing protein n=1 Tax=Fretibacter rubidus TaxID=570162 RepID=UPI00352B77AB